MTESSSCKKQKLLFWEKNIKRGFEINPSKSEISKIGRHILDKINKLLLSSKNVNQWKNTSNAINWLENINNKKQSSFLNFEVENFYPSISEKLLIDVINFAKSSANITEQDLFITMQSRKTLLFQNSEPWMKKLGNENFDVPMGCYYSAELYELTGSFILNQLTSIVNKSDIGLNCDDGLGIFYNVSKPETERKKKAKFLKGVVCLSLYSAI